MTTDYLISQRIWFFCGIIHHIYCCKVDEQAIYYRFLFATQNNTLDTCAYSMECGFFMEAIHIHNITPVVRCATAAALHSQWINLMIEWHKATFCGLSAPPPPTSTNNLLKPSLFRCEFNAPVWERLIKVITRAIIAGHVIWWC